MPLLVLAVVTMTVAQLLDLSTFMAMIQKLGPTAEANPLVAGMLADYGVPMAVVAKVALIAFVVAIAVVLAARERRRERVLVAAVLGVAILAGIVGGGTNVLTMGPL